MTERRASLREMSLQPGTVSDVVVTIHIPGVDAGSNINPFAPDSIQGLTKPIVLL